MARFFTHRPVFACVIALLLLLGGGLSLQQLPVTQYPSIAPPTVRVSAAYPGASAETMEETVTAIIEQEMNGLEGLQSMSSSSSANGSAEVFVIFDPEVDFDVALVEVNNRVKQVEARLPEPVRRQGVSVQKATRNFMMILALRSADASMDAIDLGNYAHTRVVDELRRLKGVGEALVFGTEYAMRIWLDPIRVGPYTTGSGLFSFYKNIVVWGRLPPENA